MKRTEPDPRRDPAKSWNIIDTVALIVLVVSVAAIGVLGEKLSRPPCVASEEQPAPAQRPCNWRAE